MPIFATKLLSCVVCGKEKARLRSYKNYCSQKCKFVFLDTFAPPKFGEATCPVCQIVFEKKAFRNIFCSKICRDQNSVNERQIIKSEFSIFKRDNFKCIYCGKSSIEDSIKLIVEHIEPFSLGGLTDINNLVTSCKECNQSKSSVPLSNDVVKRLLDILQIRNKKLSEIQLNELIDDVKKHQYYDKGRKKSLMKIA